jgi:hypothetical protein
VRVQARRLRAKVHDYYGTRGECDSIVIDAPTGGYAPVFRSFTGTAAHTCRIAPVSCR